VLVKLSFYLQLVIDIKDIHNT